MGLPVDEASAGSPRSQGEITELLRSWAGGDDGARDRLFELVYPKLRRLAAGKLRGEIRRPTLQTTELVSEAFLRLVDQTRVDWQCRAQFFALAATMIRRILVDRARRRLRAKRGPATTKLALSDVDPPVEEPSLQLLALDRALEKLAELRAIDARIVELRYFAGLSIDDTARTLGLGPATVGRRWRFAKAWLAERLDSAPP